MAMVRKKQDDKFLEALRELITTGGGNRQCFDCGQKGPTYVNMTIGSFVCTRCSGVLRGITPPHRVKSISMATFTQDEIDFLKAHGNDVCAKTWLGLWDPKRAVHQDQRELMIDKYERKRYYLEPASPLKSLTNATNLKTNTTAATATSSSTSSTSASATANNHNNSSSNNNSNKTHIQLTPPTSQRTTANGLHKTSSTAISRPQHTAATQQQNGFSSSLSNHHNGTDAFGLHNGLNSSVGSMSTGALSDTSSCASANGFGAEADFVADFGSADIFNATVASSPASSVGSSTTNNGYAKIQPMKISAQQQFMNGHGGVNNNGNLQNGGLSNGNTENFADFDHAPIYNAAVEEPSNYQFVRKNAIRKKSTSSITSGSIIRRNERQLKDILEMENLSNNNNNTNDNVMDYINFNEDEVFTKTSAKSGGYSNIFEDFDNLLTLDSKNGQNSNFGEFESDYVNVVKDHKGGSATKFTPLALAAHATAMAVLGNQSHFNATPAATAQQTQQWGQEAWLAEKDVLAKTWFPSNNNFSSNPYGKSQQQQQYPYASINNLNTGNFQTAQQQQHPQQHQYFPPSLNASSTQTLIQSLPTPAPPPPPPTSSSLATAATLFETAKTTTTTIATATISATSLSTTTSMLNNKNSTNPFRILHLDVNDNYNTINYDNDNFLNNFNTTNITPTTTLSTTTTPSTFITKNDTNLNNDFNNDFNTDFSTDFNSNYNDFNFVSNSILSFNFDLFSTATTSATTNTFSNSLTTTTTSLQNQNSSNKNFLNNSYTDPFVYQDHNLETFQDISKNPFSNTFKIPQDQISEPGTSISETSVYYSPSSTISFTSYISPTSSSIQTPPSTNPFKFNATEASPTFQASSNTSRSLDLPVVDDDDANANDYKNKNLNNYKNNYDSLNHIEDNFSSNNNFYNNYNSNPANSNCNFNSFNSNANQSQISNQNLNQNPNNYQNDSNNNNTNNNSWRLPINNNNNKNSTTTNGFNNSNNNHNNNNLNNNNNSSAPAEDRYAALKDLDEQLRESKAVAAQAASIVTANVVDSGFGNPNVNVNGTVNPFATHHHQQQHQQQQQQSSVVNPFQNASNNPQTQNATQQLFGQMTLIPNGIAAANGFLNPQKTHTANTGFFNYTASGYTTNANTPQIQQHQQQQQQHQQASMLYPTSIQTGPNGCGFGFGTLQQQIASTGTGLTTNTFNNPFAATGALNSNNPFL